MFITLMAPLASLGLAAPGWGRVARLLLRPGPDGPGDARYLASRLKALGCCTSRQNSGPIPLKKKIL